MQFCVETVVGAAVREGKGRVVGMKVGLVLVEGVWVVFGSVVVFSKLHGNNIGGCSYHWPSSSMMSLNCWRA
jgi:hypothetical protein